jgi:hypothetical protein
MSNHLKKHQTNNYNRISTRDAFTQPFFLFYFVLFSSCIVKSVLTRKMQIWVMVVLLVLTILVRLIVKNGLKMPIANTTFLIYIGFEKTTRTSTMGILMTTMMIMMMMMLMMMLMTIMIMIIIIIVIVIVIVIVIDYDCDYVKGLKMSITATPLPPINPREHGPFIYSRTLPHPLMDLSRSLSRFLSFLRLLVKIIA